MPHCPGSGRHTRPDDLATTKPMPPVASTGFIGQTSSREPDAVARAVPVYPTTARVYGTDGQDFTIGIHPLRDDGGPVRRLVVSFPAWVTIGRGMAVQVDAETVLGVWINQLGLLAGTPPLPKQSPSLLTSRKIGRFV